MALVRRASVMGPAAGHVMAGHVMAGHVMATTVSQAPPAPAVGYAQVPRPGGADGDSAAPGYPASVGAAGPPASFAAVAAGPVAAGPGMAVALGPAFGGDAAAVASRPPSFLAIVAGFGLAGLGLLAAYAFKASGNGVQPFQIGNQMSTFGALFVFAAAVERVLEPVSQWLPGRHTKAEFERAVAALANRHPMVSIADVATAKARMERARANRTIVVWGLATGFATLLSAWGGFYLLHMLSANPSWDAVPGWVDALVTGLVVGSGTKPLHDVLTRVQKTKERAEDPTQ
jgi:hypothetical protein